MSRYRVSRDSAYDSRRRPVQLWCPQSNTLRRVSGLLTYGNTRYELVPIPSGWVPRAHRTFDGQDLHWAIVGLASGEMTLRASVVRVDALGRLRRDASGRRLWRTISDRLIQKVHVYDVYDEVVYDVHVYDVY